MKNQLTLVALAVALIFGCISCSLFKSTANTASTPQNSSANETAVQPEAASGRATTNQDIRKVDFKNFTYQPACVYEGNKNVTVKNGEYSYEKPADGYTDHFYFKVFDVSYGDLNNDNSEEAVVLTVCNTGGTGNFTEGFIYTLKDGKPALFAHVPGGDRADGGLRTAEVDNGQLVIETNDPGEAGGACCPEFILTTHYDVSGGKLKQLGKVDRRPVFPTERVKFDKGSTGTTIRITLPANEGKRYIVGARAGQILDTSVNTDKATVRLLEDAETTDNTNGFSATLPKNGDYTVEVSNFDDKPIEVVLNIKIR